RTLPVSVSRQRACNRSNRGPDADVTNTFLPTTIGDETLRPGRSAFHLTFSLSLQVVGRPVSSETPDAFGPRNCGQSPAEAKVADARTVAMQIRRFMGLPAPKAETHGQKEGCKQRRGQFTDSASLTGSAPPVASLSRSWNCHSCAQSSF